MSSGIASPVGHSQVFCVQAAKLVQQATCRKEIVLCGVRKVNNIAVGNGEILGPWTRVHLAGRVWSQQLGCINH